MSAPTLARPMYYLSSEVADHLGIHLNTLRRWERRGLIPPPVRRNGRRLYTEADIAVIRSRVEQHPAEAATERPSTAPTS